MGRHEKLRRSYRFLTEKERLQEDFTVEELATATGWTISTVRTYLNKKWDQFVVKGDDVLRANGIGGFTEEEYVRLMSQRQVVSVAPKRPHLNPRVENLVVKAREAALHGLDSYNRPATLFRTEGLIVMMVIAWTSLFHAIFEKRGISYFYTLDDGSPRLIDGDKQAWDLAKCMSQYFGDSNPPAKANLHFILGLRNRIEHRFVPAIDAHAAGECQALVFNFDELLVEEFSEYYALRDSLAIPLQTTNLRTGGQFEVMKRFQGQAYDELKDYMDAYRANLPDAIYQDPRYSFRVYLIPKIGNHESSSDIAFEFVKYDPSKPDDMAALERHVALIRERQIPVVNAGRYKPTQVAQLVATKLGRAFKVHNHTQAWKMYGVRNSGEDPEGCNTKYCQFDSVHRDYVYTEEWVAYLVQKLSDEEEYRRLKAFRLQ